jgi:hypothetical protein
MLPGVPLPLHCVSRPHLQSSPAKRFQRPSAKFGREFCTFLRASPFPFPRDIITAGKMMFLYQVVPGLPFLHPDKNVPYKGAERRRKMVDRPRKSRECLFESHATWNRGQNAYCIAQRDTVQSCLRLQMTRVFLLVAFQVHGSQRVSAFWHRGNSLLRYRELILSLNPSSVISYCTLLPISGESFPLNGHLVMNAHRCSNLRQLCSLNKSNFHQFCFPTSICMSLWCFLGLKFEYLFFCAGDAALHASQPL